MADKPAPCYHDFSGGKLFCRLCKLPRPGDGRLRSGLNDGVPLKGERWPSRRKKTAGEFTAPVPLEKVEQRNTVDLLTRIGAKVYEIGRPRQQKCHACGAQSKDLGTRQTPGIPDLFVFLPIGRSNGPIARPRYVWIEMKRQGATESDLTTEQKEFREFCRERSITRIDGAFDKVVDWLASHGFVRE
jgi:hypothetical protein